MGKDKGGLGSDPPEAGHPEPRHEMSWVKDPLRNKALLVQTGSFAGAQDDEKI